MCSTCARLTGENRFLTTELLSAWQAEGRPAVAEATPELAAIVPATVQRRVTAELDGLSSEAKAVARATAVLGDGASVRRVAKVAEVDADAALRAATDLAAAGFLRSAGLLSFTRPLARSAVMASLSAFERARLHRLAASVPIDERADVEEVAAHLLPAPPDRDANTIQILRAAAKRATESGALERAAELLERALAEHGEDEVRGELLAELAHAEALAGSPNAGWRLEQAVQLGEHPERRAVLLIAQGRTLHAQRRYRDAAAVLDRALAEVRYSAAAPDPRVSPSDASSAEVPLDSPCRA